MKNSQFEDLLKKKAADFQPAVPPEILANVKAASAVGKAGVVKTAILKLSASVVSKVIVGIVAAVGVYSAYKYAQSENIHKKFVHQNEAVTETEISPHATAVEKPEKHKLKLLPKKNLNTAVLEENIENEINRERVVRKEAKREPNKGDSKTKNINSELILSPSGYVVDNIVDESRISAYKQKLHLPKLEAKDIKSPISNKVELPGKLLITSLYGSDYVINSIEKKQNLESDIIKRPMFCLPEIEPKSNQFGQQANGYYVQNLMPVFAHRSSNNAVQDASGNDLNMLQRKDNLPPANLIGSESNSEKQEKPLVLADKEHESEFGVVSTDSLQQNGFMTKLSSVFLPNLAKKHTILGKRNRKLFTTKITGLSFRSHVEYAQVFSIPKQGTNGSLKTEQSGEMRGMSASVYKDMSSKTRMGVIVAYQKNEMNTQYFSANRKDGNIQRNVNILSLEVGAELDLWRFNRFTVNTTTNIGIGYKLKYEQAISGKYFDTIHSTDLKANGAWGMTGRGALSLRYSFSKYFLLEGGISGGATQVDRQNWLLNFGARLGIVYAL